MTGTRAGIAAAAGVAAIAIIVGQRRTGRLAVTIAAVLGADVVLTGVAEPGGEA